MGWNSWNGFNCNVSDSLIRETADALIANGMKEVGYKYVVIDDCWAVARGPDGIIIPDPERFPYGMKALADYVHSVGLLIGIYTDGADLTCQRRPGSLGHEKDDAETYAAWGIDYLKEDWCFAEALNPRVEYKNMREHLNAAGRPIVFSLCNAGYDAAPEWAPTIGNLWRTTTDIQNSWASMLTNFDTNSTFAAIGGPGHWNDPDMLEVGNGMPDNENQAHMSLWAMSAAPLIAGNDLRQMSAATRAVLTNREVIDIDQDPAGIAGTLVFGTPELQVWSRPLANPGERAILFLNRTQVATPIPVDWGSVGLGEAPTTIRDLWAHSDIGWFDTGFSPVVPARGVVFVKVRGVELAPPAPGSHALSDLRWSYAANGKGHVERDWTAAGQPFSINGKTYEKGIGMYSEGQIRYQLGGKCSLFKSEVGVDDDVQAGGTVTFEVWVDGVKKYDSAIMRPHQDNKAVAVDLTNANELKLVVTGGGDDMNGDHAAWGNPLLVCTGVCDPSAPALPPGSGPQEGP